MPHPPPQQQNRVAGDPGLSRDFREGGLDERGWDPVLFLSSPAVWQLVYPLARNVESRNFAASSRKSKASCTHPPIPPSRTPRESGRWSTLYMEV